MSSQYGKDVYQVVEGKAPLAEAHALLHSQLAEDSGFPCRHPVFYRYLSTSSIYQPKAATCKDKVPFLVQSQQGNPKVFWLDPARVQAIHLIYAGKGPRFMSRFGHVSLRLIVCPEHVPLEESCDVYLHEHVVLGYMAHVDDFAISPIKGLFGGYKAYLYASHFIDVYQEYAIGEFREIYSVPLNLDRAQRERMVRELADIHWSFSGEYRFLGSNCSTLLQQALSVLWDDFATSSLSRRIRSRPDRFFKAGLASGLLDAGAVASLKQAERDGFYFSSTAPYYEAAAEVVADNMQHPYFSSVESYLRAPAQARSDIRQRDAEFLERLGEDVRLKEALLMLEEYALIRTERAMKARFAMYLKESDFFKKARENEGALSAHQKGVLEYCLLQPIKGRLQPDMTTTGIPQNELKDVTQRDHIDCTSAESVGHLRAAMRTILGDDPGEQPELKKLIREYTGSLNNIFSIQEAGGETIR